MNIVLDEAYEEKEGGEKVAIGMIVRHLHHLILYRYETQTKNGTKVIRGNSVVMLEALERINDK
jgi:small nuclear ribonucleoprotein G